MTILCQNQKIPKEILKGSCHGGHRLMEVPNKVVCVNSGHTVINDKSWGWPPRLIAVTCSQAKLEHFYWISHTGIPNKVTTKERAKMAAIIWSLCPKVNYQVS